MKGCSFAVALTLAISHREREYKESPIGIGNIIHLPLGDGRVRVFNHPSFNEEYDVRNLPLQGQYASS